MAKKTEVLNEEEMLVLASITLETVRRFVERNSKGLWSVYTTLWRYKCIDDIERQGQKLKGLANSCDNMLKYLNKTKQRLYGKQGEKQNELRKRLQQISPMFAE